MQKGGLAWFDERTGVWSALREVSRGQVSGSRASVEGTCMGKRNPTMAVGRHEEDGFMRERGKELKNEGCTWASLHGGACMLGRKRDHR